MIMTRFLWNRPMAGPIAGLGLWVILAGLAPAQTPDAALKDRVLQLVERLDDPKEEVRQDAEARLIKLGARILPLLPESSGADKPEKKQRLDRIRSELEAAGKNSASTLNLVTINGKGIRLSEALQQLQKQTGNAITDLREQLGAEVTNPTLDLDLQNLCFFEALDRVTSQAGVSITPYTGDGTIGITGGMASASEWIQYEGPFRVALRQLGTIRDFQAGTSTATVQFEIGWEPRLRPMLLKLASEKIVVKDDQGRDVKPQSMMESNETVLQPEMPVAEVNINLEAPERSATKLAILQVEAEVTVPDSMLTFHFPKLTVKGETLEKNRVKVTLENAEVDEQLWRVEVLVEYPDGGPSFESFRQGLFSNRVWLRNADGARFEQNGGVNNTAADGGKLGFEYLFTDVPGKLDDYQLVYEAPSQIVTIPLKIEFKNVPLP